MWHGVKFVLIVDFDPGVECFCAGMPFSVPVDWEERRLLFARQNLLIPCCWMQEWSLGACFSIYLQLTSSCWSP